MARAGRMHHKVATAAPSVTYRLTDTRSKATTATDDDDDDRTDARSETDNDGHDTRLRDRVL